MRSLVYDLLNLRRFVFTSPSPITFLKKSFSIIPTYVKTKFAWELMGHTRKTAGFTPNWILLYSLCFVCVLCLCSRIRFYIDTYVQSARSDFDVI